MRLTAFCVLFVIACSTPWRSTYFWKTDIPDPAHEAISSAAQRWNTACGELMFDERYRDSSFPAYIVDRPDGYDRVAGYALPSGGPIVIFSHVPPQYMEYVAVHEFGHAAGLMHLDGGIMSADIRMYDAPLDPGPVEIAELRRYGWGCPE